MRSSWPASAPPASTGNILATVAGPRCPVPIIGHRSAGIPGWVGAADVVIAVSASGRSPEALAAADAAARRGARLVAIGNPDTELQAMAERARAPFIPVPRRAPARASLWGLAVPVLLAARAIGLVKVNEADLAETATRLDADAERCRPGADSFVNPAKSLALGLAGSIPIVWGSSPLATVAARRFADTLAANARYPVMAGALGEAGRGRVGLLDGVFGGLAESSRDIFADPDQEEDPALTRLRLVHLPRRRPQPARTTPTSRSPSRSAAPTPCRRWPSAAACAATCSPPRAARRWSGSPR